jgi:hypothetical protein
MDTLLFIQSKLLGKGFFTHITDIRMLSSMYTVVYCEVTLKIETFTTQTAGIWIVIIMHEHMFFQGSQVKEQHITHITVIWSLLTMYDFMLLPVFLNGK